MDSLASPPLPLPDLILSLEQATLMAKQLPSTTRPDHLLQIYSSLHQAHKHLSSFISQSQFSLSPPPPHASAEDHGDEPMQLGDDDSEAGIEEATIDKVQEKMRDCFIKNKRLKRPLSPSSLSLVDDGDAGGKNFDPYGTRLKALELIYQFHG